jgi:hypothetical protein
MAEKLLDEAVSRTKGTDTRVLIKGLLTETEKVMLVKRVLVGVLILSGWELVEIAETVKLSRSTVYKLAQRLQMDLEYAGLLGRLFPRKIPWERENRSPSALVKFMEDILAGRRQRSRLQYPLD